MEETSNTSGNSSQVVYSYDKDIRSIGKGKGKGKREKRNTRVLMRTPLDLDLGGKEREGGVEMENKEEKRSSQLRRAVEKLINAPLTTRVRDGSKTDEDVSLPENIVSKETDVPLPRYRHSLEERLSSFQEKLRAIDPSLLE